MDIAGWITDHESAIRLTVFLLVFGLMAAWELLAPRRASSLPRSARWPSNLGLLALNTVVARLVLPVAAVGVATAVEARGGGLLPLLGLSYGLQFVLALVLLDLVIYLQHVLFHASPLLWRLHRMHHADTEVDATNGLRFHTLEILLSMLLKMAVVAVLGAPAAAVVVFEVLLNALAVFNHSNVAIPAGVDRALRLLVVTPDMHRVHHSWRPEEHNSNYGFNLTCWDRIFRTYRAQPAEGHQAMTLGLPVFRAGRWRRLDQMLVQPFLGDRP